MKLRTQVLIAVAGMAIAAGVGCTTGETMNQPHMQNALSDLQAANGELQAAEPNKGGHREAAISLVNQAIGEVQAGIAYAGG